MIFMALHYTKKTIERFRNPKFAGEIKNPDGVATEGSPACGDMITTYLKVDEKTKKIQEVKFKSFGCASNIATADVISEKAIGKTIDEVEQMDLATAARELGGLPPIKMHCSVLAVSTLKAAIRDYKQKHGVNVEAEKLSEEKVWEKLHQVINPEIGLNIVRLKMVRNIRVESNGNVFVEISLGNTDEMFAPNIKEEIEEHLKELNGTKKVEVKIEK